MVSVIIPNYNHALYLNQRIDSVLNQTYQDIEVIILDDYSPDNSRDIIETYRNHPKVSHIIYNKTNSGSTFKQWEKGISLAKGEYIWIAESDDWADLSFLSKIIHSIRENNSSVCFSMSRIVDQNNNFKNNKLPIIAENMIGYKEFLRESLLFQNSIYNASMVVFRKNIIQDQIWNEICKLKFCGDWLFWSAIIESSKGTVSEVKEYLNHFRTHGSNVSGKSEVKGLTFLEGFPISLKVAKLLKMKKSKEFSQKWFEQWHWYRLYYLFSKKVNLEILLMFLFKDRNIVFLELKRLFLRILKK